VVRCTGADKGAAEEVLFTQEVTDSEISFGVRVEPGAVCRFSYGIGGVAMTEAGEPFTAREGVWIGAKIGFFALRDGVTNDAGYAGLDWFRINATD